MLAVVFPYVPVGQYDRHLVISFFKYGVADETSHY